MNQQSNSTQGNKTPVGAFIRFAAKANQTVKVKVGTSFTSLEGAHKNLRAEIPDWNFNKVRQNSAAAWNQALGKVQVQATQEQDLSLFYTALYHTKLLPRIFNDVDGSYPGFAEDNNVYKAAGFNYYEDFSMWDTYRRTSAADVAGAGPRLAYGAISAEKSRTGRLVAYFPLLEPLHRGHDRRPRNRHDRGCHYQKY